MFGVVFEQKRSIKGAAVVRCQRSCPAKKHEDSVRVVVPRVPRDEVGKQG